MKTVSIFVILAAVLVMPLAFAEDMAKPAAMGDMGEKGMMKMYQCPMDKYTSEKAGKCPMCGMDLEEKEMTADEAKAALEASKAESKE